MRPSMHSMFAWKTRHARTEVSNFVQLMRQTDRTDVLAGQQLQSELNAFIRLEAEKNYVDGANDSLLFQMLPVEVRQNIWSYLVVVPESVHVFPVKRNVRQGFRLSRCGDDSMNLRNGWCECNSDGITQNATPPSYLDTEMLLVSRTVRREVLDVMFAQNHFTFTSLRDLEYFADNFSKCAAKIQNIRLLARLSDSHAAAWSVDSCANSRRRIGTLKSFTLYAYLDGFNAYETYHHDGFISNIIHLAFPIVDNFECFVRPSRIWGTDNGLEDAAKIVQQKLDDVFHGKWENVDSIPLAAPPPKKIPESEVPPLIKKGILALGD